VIWDEAKALDRTPDNMSKKEYCQKWCADHADELYYSLGDQMDHFTFVNELFFSPSTARQSDSTQAAACVSGGCSTKAVKLASDRRAILTPYGETICRQHFEAVQVENYEVEISNYDDVHECNVRHCAGGVAHEVLISGAPDEHGSRFGTCSCGVHKMKTVPCVHMIAVVKSGLSSVNVMPSWCYTSVWREQFGEGTVMHAGCDIQYLKDNYQPNQKSRYCPKISAAAKTGRKKNLKRFKSLLEKGAKKKGKKRPLLDVAELGEDGQTEDM
jgi:hypothetical protein